MIEYMPRMSQRIIKDTDRKNSLTSVAIEIIEMEKVVPVDIEIDNSIRAKVTDICGMTCNFCHNEGTPVNSLQANKGRVSIFEDTNDVTFKPGIMLPNSLFQTTLETLIDVFEVSELHWTGGEPTTHQDLALMTKIARDLGLKVRMTSNGETGGKNLNKLVEAGLESINFSIFGITAEEIVQVQGLKNQDIKKAAVKLMKLDESIKTASSLGIRTKANIVMKNESDSSRIKKVINKYSPLGVEVRILPDISDGISSLISIYNLLGELGAVPEKIKVTAGSSNFLISYILPNGKRIGFKQIRNSRFPDVCDPCEYNTEDDCKEGYYGIRFYIDTDNKYYVGVCLQRMNLTVPLDEFVTGLLPKAIIKFRQDDFKALQNQFEKKKSL